MTIEELQTRSKRLDQKAESWKSNIRRILPHIDSDQAYGRILPYRVEAEKLALDSLSFSFSNMTGMDLEVAFDPILKRSKHLSKETTCLISHGLGNNDEDSTDFITIRV